MHETQQTGTIPSKSSIDPPDLGGFEHFYDSNTWVRTRAGTLDVQWFGLGPGSLISYLICRNS